MQSENRNRREPCYLTLENGQVFSGYRFGASSEAIGELVFTTAMTGYLETLTDPSYYGQMVVQTFPLIGNYGVIPADFESDSIHMNAYIVREWCSSPSNFRCEGDVDGLLQAHNIVGMYGVDTRALTKIIREHGVMNAQITSDPNSVDLAAIRRYRVSGAVEAAGSKTVTQACPPDTKYKVVLWDFGAKGNITRELLNRGCEVVTVPANATAEQILSFMPDGLMLSNGPGDPADNSGIIQELAKLERRHIPTFGICLGHQLLALSQGAKTEKLKYGHRGANQPVRDIAAGQVYITSQNHGYAVTPASLPDSAALSFVNSNDGTCEGIRYTNLPAFSVQFHPEACAGPQDTNFLFDQFIQLMKEAR